ncbi:MAG: Phosphoenolpyruvate-protein phosphotransferase [Candidatus Methanogaster sp.]|nr:MAG: Phosphoenolpyruvate-protein phosphotransferase [ANME-2 cluster archaeon]
MLKVDDVEQEIARFRDALEVAKAQIESIQSQAIAEVGEETAAIFTAHAMFLEDPELLGQITRRMEADGINAEFAVQETIESYAAIFAAMDDEYMSARGADIKDVGQRLLRVLMGKEEVPLSELSSPVVVIAHDLTPSDTARMNKDMVLGFATETGGKTSHTAIMARILGIPAVVALSQLLDEVRTGDTVVVDGGEGLLVVEPDDGTICECQSRRGEDQKRQDALREDAQLQAG